MLAPRGTSKHKLEPNFLTKNPTFHEHPIFTRIDEEEFDKKKRRCAKQADAQRSARHQARRVGVTKIWSGRGTGRVHRKAVSGVKLSSPPILHFVLCSIVF